MPTLRGLGDEGECDASVRGRVRCPCRRRLHLQSRSTARVQPRRSRVPERVGKCLGGSAGGRRTARKSVISLQCEIPVRLMTASGHSRPMRSKPREHVCPLLPESGQTGRRLGTSALCQKRPNAAQQMAPLFKHLVGAAEEGSGHTQRFRGLEIDHKLRAIPGRVTTTRRRRSQLLPEQKFFGSR